MTGMNLTPLITLHAAYVSSGFILMVSGLTVARRLKQIDWWLKVHRFLEIAGVAFVWAGSIQAVAMISLSGDEHFGNIHAYNGLAIMFLVLLQPATGQAQLRVRNPVFGMQHIHRWTGRLILALMFINFALGLMLL
jgi:hypothetical protein